MATSGSINTSSYDGRYGKLSWSSTSSGNKSTINWTFTLLGGNSKWYITSQCYFTISCSKGTSSTSNVTVLPYDTSRKGYLNDSWSGSFTITHNSSAQACFSINLYLAVYNYAVNCTGSGSWDLPTLYTACSAPTTITASGIVKPGGTCTVSWSGAKAGTNNPITGYRIFYRISSSGAAPTAADTYKYGDSSSGSITFNVPSNATRGYKIVFGVVTKGKDGYWSGLKTGGLVTVNSLPAAPTVTVDKTKIPSTGGTVKFTVTAGTDADGQTRTLYYAASASGTKTKFTSPLSVSLNAGATYYFWTYDGLEYSSSYTSQKIEKNVKPSFSLDSTPTTYTVGNSGSYTYAVKPTIDADKTGTVKITLEMSTSTSFSSIKTATFSNFNLTSTAATAMSTYNVITSITNNYGVLTNDIYWRLKFVLNDGMEDSSTKILPSSGHYTVKGAAPSTITKYNQHDNSDISNSHSGEMGTKARFIFPNDGLMTVPTVTYTGKGQSGTATATTTTGTSGNNRYVNVTLKTDNIESGEQITFTVKLSNSAGTISRSFTITMEETLKPNLNNKTVIHSPRIINPFNKPLDTSTLTIKTTWPFGSETDIDIAKNKYNCKGQDFKLLYASDSNGTNATTAGYSWSAQELEWKRSTDYLTTKDELNKNNAFKFSGGTNFVTSMKPYSGSKKYYVAIRITNLFGQSFMTNWLECTFDFNELPDNLTIKPIQYSQSKNGNYSDLDGKYLQQSLYLKFKSSFNAYTSEKYTIRLMKQIGDNGSFVKQLEKTISVTNDSYAGGIEESVEFIYGPIGEITDSLNRYWQIQIINSSGSISLETPETSVYRQTSPTMSITSAEIDNNQLTINFDISDNGLSKRPDFYDGSISYYIAGVNSSRLKITGQEISAGRKVINISGASWESTTIFIEADSEILKEAVNSYACIDSSKTYNSIGFVVYNLSPTIAHRKNYIGINTKNPDSSSVIDITATTGKDRIIFKGKDNENNSIEIQIYVNGIIKYLQNNTELHSIDLANGIYN